MVFTILKALNSDLGRKVLIILAVIASIFYIHYHGYKKGEAEQKAYYEAEYNKKLNEVLKQRESLQKEVHEEAKETVQAEVRIKTVYKDKVVIVEKLIEKSPEIKDCKWNEEAFQEYLNKRREIK